jgi:7,8-dihydro-6-hydroxymethylpterin dimethyltransferase
MKTLGVTHSVCETCLAIVPTKVIEKQGAVYFEKFCRQHGSSVTQVHSDAGEYLRALSCVKAAWIPQEFAGDAGAACPDGCGYCSRHEQHLCMPLVEITSRCNLACPICLVDAGRQWDMSLNEFERIINGLIAAERQVDILNLSGGEPLLHPQLLEMVDLALSRPEIVRASISTNGLVLLEQPELLDRLRQRNVVISLQLDGFSDEPYRILRGRPLLAEKTQILAMLEEQDVSTSLTMTLAAGVNEDQLPAVAMYLLSKPNVVSLMIQPLALTGRGRSMAGAVARLSIPDVIRLLDQARSVPISARDFSPLPCSHPLCFSQAFYLTLDGGGTVSLDRLVSHPQRMDAVANRTIFGLDADDQDRLKDMVYEIWSAAADVKDSPAQRGDGGCGLCPCMADKVMTTMRGMLDEMAAGRFDARRAFTVSERRVKSIFIHAFQDPQTFDLARVRRCCNAYPQPDGRLIPACVHNVRRRPATQTANHP